MKNISSELRRIRTEKGFTQKQLAEAVSVAPSTISSYEQGVRKPDYEMLEKFSRVLGVNILEFIDDSGASDLVKNHKEIESMINKILILDAADRARIDERLNMMLESEKYRSYKKVI